MKLKNKENGRTIVEGQFELSKIGHITIAPTISDINKVDTWFMFHYYGDNLVKKHKYFGQVLYMCAEITVKDHFISIDATSFNEEFVADVQLTTAERERLLVFIINCILDKEAVEVTWDNE